MAQGIQIKSVSFILQNKTLVKQLECTNKNNHIINPVCITITNNRGDESITLQSLHLSNRSAHGLLIYCTNLLLCLTK